MDPAKYKGYVIIAQSDQLKTGKWKPQCQIGHYDKQKQEEIIKSFSPDKEYDTEEEAINYSLEFGKQIIDGKVKNCSAD